MAKFRHIWSHCDCPWRRQDHLLVNIFVCVLCFAFLGQVFYQILFFERHFNGNDASTTRRSYVRTSATLKTTSFETSIVRFGRFWKEILPLSRTIASLKHKRSFLPSCVLCQKYSLHNNLAMPAPAMAEGEFQWDALLQHYEGVNVINICLMGRPWPLVCIFTFVLFKHKYYRANRLLGGFELGSSE